MKKSLFSIGNMSKLTGIHIKSLRYYEDIGVLIPAYVDPLTKYRYYSYQQIPNVMAIRFCLELGIPLINFKKYQDREKGYLYYDELIKDGQILLNEKIEEINKMKWYINASIEEMHRSKSQAQGKVFQRKIEQIDVLLRMENTNNQNYLNNIGFLIDKTKSEGLETGYDFGSCSVFCKNEFEYYTFVDLNTSYHDNKFDFFPSGLYSCVIDKNISVKDAPQIFPDIYKSNVQVLAVESQIFSSKYDLKSPLIELKVIGLESEVL